LLTDPGTVSQLIKEEEQHTCRLVKRYSDKMQAAGVSDMSVILYCHILTAHATRNT